MNKKRIAVVCGGFSGENPISMKSADGILSWLDQELFDSYKVIIDKSGWYVNYNDHNISIDRSDFSFIADREKIKFDYAYITIHGTPGEDGVIQGYFDLIGLPYNTAGVLQEAISFNKFFCNRYLSTFPEINIAKSVRLTIDNSYNCEELASMLGLPLFVKPNVGGSSVATTKVTDKNDLEDAILLAFKEAPEVMIEEFLSGMEVTCGCYSLSGQIFALPITEVVSKRDFFDFDAKYNGAVEEITPARISDDMTKKIQSITKDIYKHLSARGIIRVDYIISNSGEVKLLEVNTTPGMTSTSFIPQQIKADNKSVTKLLTAIILNKPY